MLPKLKYNRENGSRISGMTAGMTQAAAQQTLSNVIKLRQRMSPDVHAIVNGVAHQRALTFVTDDKGPCGRPSSPHAAVAALTEGLSHIVANYLHGTTISVGGTAWDNLNGMHVCQLDNDGRNEQRFLNYLSIAKRRGKETLIADINNRANGGGDEMCFAGAYQCKRSANNLLFNNSHYDFTFHDLARTMLAHGARTAYIIGLHPREMLINDLKDYHDSEFNIAWRIQDGDVTVGFGDGSNAYKHNYAEYMKWIRTTCWSSGHVNLVFETDFWGPCAIITATMTSKRTSIPRFIALPAPVVAFLDFKYYAMQNLGTAYKYDTIMHFLDARIFAQLESYAISKTDVAWSYPTFAAYTKAQATVMTLTDGEWRHYGNQSTLHRLTSDGSVSLFVWLSALRASRSQLVGKAYRAIAEELQCDVGIINGVWREIMSALTEKKHEWCPEFLAKLASYSALVEPRFTAHDGAWFTANIKGCNGDIIFAPYEAMDEIDTAEDAQPSAEDADLMAVAIYEYTNRIAPLELNTAETELAIRDEDDKENGLYKAVAASCKAAMASQVKGFNGKVEIVEGGPGTGKTQYEAENMLNSDIAMVPTRMAKQDLESRLKIANKTNKVFTNHSAVLYALGEGRDKHEGCKVWIDEAFLQHPGQGLLVAAALKANTIVFVGDSKQIKAKDFTGAQATVQTQHFISLGEHKTLRMNFRSPAMVVEMLNNKFGYDMIPKSPVVGSMETREIKSLDELIQPPLSLDKSWHALTFTQEMKRTCLLMGLVANTVHEFQGSSDRRTALIITNDLEENFTSDVGYFIVGFSRCTEKLLVIKTVVTEGVAFKDIIIGNTDLEALTDLFSPVACVMSLPENKVTFLPSLETQAHFNTNFSMEDVANVFDRYWHGAHPATDNIRSVYRTRVPRSAEMVRIRPGLINSIEQEIKVASFGDYCYLADQEGSNSLAMIDTFITRNGGSRIIIKRELAERIAGLALKRQRRKLFTCPIKPLTLEELSLGFERFVRKTIVRGKQRHYIDADILDLKRLSAFMKTQLKSKWEPTRENFASLYEEVQKPIYGAAMEGKAGQGVVGWSKPLCFAYAAWVNAIEDRTIKELKPWVIYATQLSEDEAVGRINHVLRTYHKCVLVKGDDVAIVYTDKTGAMRTITWDAEKFDSTQASGVMATQAAVMSAYGMPAQLVNYYFNFMQDGRLKSLCNVLDMHLTFCRHSGGYETLWGNTLHSLNMIAMCVEIDDAGDWREAKFSREGLRVMTAALGARLKVKEGPVGDFIGYILQDYSMRPDIMRLAAKVIGRKFSLGSAITNQQKEAYISEAPELRKAPKGHLSLYHNIVEYGQAIADRLSTIRTEDDRTRTIRANADYYMPFVPKAEAYANLSLILDALATFSRRTNAPHYYRILAKRITTKFILPIENKADETDMSHYMMDDATAARIIIDLDMINNVVDEPEAYVYGVDAGWNFTRHAQLINKVVTLAKPLWTRILDYVIAKVRRIPVIGRLRFINWLLNKIRPPPPAQQSFEEDDEELEDDDSILAEDDYYEEDSDENEDEDDDELGEASARLIGVVTSMVDRYAANDARVNMCIKNDVNCTKTFVDFAGKRRFESNAAYKMLDALTEELENGFNDGANMLTVCDIGCAPGGCSEAFAGFKGITRVVAINAPKGHVGHLPMRYKHQKVVYREVDVTTLGSLPDAEYYFCDIQNLASHEVIKMFSDVEKAGRKLAVKVNNLDDVLASWLLERKIVLKPRRSNCYSSEFYLLTYEHPQCTTMDEYIKNWGANIANLEQRIMPAPYICDDNILLGNSGNCLSVAFEQITGATHHIKSTIHLHELLSSASINHRIIEGRRTTYEYKAGKDSKFWEINLDEEQVLEVVDKQPKEGRRERVKQGQPGEGAHDATTDAAGVAGEPQEVAVQKETTGFDLAAHLEAAEHAEKEQTIIDLRAKLERSNRQISALACRAGPSKAGNPDMDAELARNRQLTAELQTATAEAIKRIKIEFANARALLAARAAEETEAANASGGESDDDAETVADERMYEAADVNDVVETDGDANERSENPGPVVAMISLPDWTSGQLPGKYLGEYAESEICMWGPIAEELMHTIARPFTTIHPVGLTHLMCGIRYTDNVAKMGPRSYQFKAAFTLLGMPKHGFFRRCLMHMCHNYSAIAASTTHCIAAQTIEGLLQTNSHRVRWATVLVGLYCVWKQDRGPIGWFNYLTVAQHFAKNLWNARKSSWPAAFILAVFGYGGGHVHKFLRHCVYRSWMFFNVHGETSIDDVRKVVEMMAGNLRAIGMDPGSVDFETYEEGMAVLATLNQKFATLVQSMQQPKTMASCVEIRQVNSLFSKIFTQQERMNVKLPAFKAAFSAVSSLNQLRTLTNFDGAQPVQPITFDGPQPVEPITFAGPQPIEPVTFEAKQPVYFEEAQHVLVDESASEKIFDLMLGVVDVFVPGDGVTAASTAGSSIRISNNGLPLSVTGDAPGGDVVQRVEIINTELAVNVVNDVLAVEVKNAISLADGTGVAVTNIPASIDVEVVGDVNIGSVTGNVPVTIANTANVNVLSMPSHTDVHVVNQPDVNVVSMPPAHDVHITNTPNVNVTGMPAYHDVHVTNTPNVNVTGMPAYHDVHVTNNVAVKNEEGGTLHVNSDATARRLDFIATYNAASENFGWINVEHRWNDFKLGHSVGATNRTLDEYMKTSGIIDAYGYALQPFTMEISAISAHYTPGTGQDYSAIGHPPLEYHGRPAASIKLSVPVGTKPTEVMYNGNLMVSYWANGVDLYRVNELTITIKFADF